VVSGREALHVFEQLGWRFARQKGSHMILSKPEEIVRLSIPDHKQLDAGLLRGLIRKAGISVEQFLEALRSL
jgi:predicted RNA binding protein YcfA (HicA-like mRNA interferase family)